METTVEREEETGGTTTQRGWKISSRRLKKCYNYSKDIKQAAY